MRDEYNKTLEHLRMCLSTALLVSIVPSDKRYQILVSQIMSGLFWSILGVILHTLNDEHSTYVKLIYSVHISNTKNFTKYVVSINTIPNFSKI